MAGSWLTKSVEETDLPAVAVFRAMIGGGNPLFPRTPQFYAWKYFENPLQRPCVRLAEREGQIVGLVASTPRRMRIGGRTILCAELGDLFTHPNYRRQGIFTQLGKEACAGAERGGAELIYVRPNENSYPGLVKYLGFRHLFWLQPLYYLLNSRAFLRAKLGRKALILYPLARLYQSFRPRPPFKLPEGITIARESRLDESVTGLWQEVSSAYNGMIARDERYLEWRYLRSPIGFAFYTARRKGQVVGYIVTTQSADAARRLSCGYIVDLIVSPCYPFLSKVLIAHALVCLREDGADLVETWAIRGEDRDRFLRNLRGLGFIPRGRKLHFLVRTQLFQPNYFQGQWFFRLGDLDGI